MDTAAEVERLLSRLRSPGANDFSTLHDLIDPNGPLAIARAPGRLDVMGGIADYSGSLVLQLPLACAAFVAVQRSPRPTIRIASFSNDVGQGENRWFETDVRQFTAAVEHGYDAVRLCFPRGTPDHWVAYVLGVLAVLLRECNVRLDDGGLSIAIDSHVPEGVGVSSSAAVEVATMTAAATVLDVELEASQLALLCQRAENRVVGAPCGVMDQMTAACGWADRLLMLRCQPADVLGYRDIPRQISFWGIDSRIRHTVSGTDYTAVRVATSMGYRMIADMVSFAVRELGDGHVAVDDLRWDGYLANISPSEFEMYFAGRLPEVIGGRQFLDHYGGTTDVVTQVDPTRQYRVRQATGHPIYENFRVAAFAELLAREPIEDVAELLGELMYQSHASYSSCGLGCEETDLLIELVRNAGTAAGLYGAKITGGGSGGTIAVLGRWDAGEAVEAIARQYAEQTGRTPTVFSGSSDGTDVVLRQ